MSARGPAEVLELMSAREWVAALELMSARGRGGWS